MKNVGAFWIWVTLLQACRQRKASAWHADGSWYPGCIGDSTAEKGWHQWFPVQLTSTCKGHVIWNHQLLQWKDHGLWNGSIKARVPCARWASSLWGKGWEASRRQADAYTSNAVVELLPHSDWSAVLICAQWLVRCAHLCSLLCCADSVYSDWSAVLILCAVIGLEVVKCYPEEILGGCSILSRSCEMYGGV